MRKTYKTFIDQPIPTFKSNKTKFRAKSLSKNIDRWFQKFLKPQTALVNCFLIYY